MLTLVRTNSDNSDFRLLVKLLDADLRVRDGADHAFYAPFNKIDTINHIIVAYDNGEAVGCGATKIFFPNIMEIKRMYIKESYRGLGIATQILNALEVWALELKYEFCVLETSKNLPEAIALYKKSGYMVINNYGQYVGVENSICFEKHLISKL